VLRAFLPNNQAWVFKWLFQTVFPTLLGMSALAQTVEFITDGDSQETSQLDNAIEKFFPQAIRVRCIWHAVDRGMTIRFPNCQVNKRTRDASRRLVRDAFEKAELQVRHFIWSWAEPDCATEEEFVLSNALFLMFLDSKEFADAMQTLSAVKEAKDFYNMHFYPILDHIVFYKRKHLLHFNTNSNSAHEGTNRGLKSHAAPTNPQHTLGNATKVLCHQAKLKTLQLQTVLAKKINATTLWSDQPCQGQLVELAVSLTSNEFDERKFYDIVGPFADANNFWLLLRRDLKTQDTELGTVPKFRRVRKIRRCNETGTLLCDCCYFDQVGIPCRHIMALLYHILGEEFKGITQDDVRVFWRIDYYFYGMQPENEMRSLLLELRDTDAKGPRLPSDKITATVLMDKNHHIVKTYLLPPSERCMNYTRSHCQQALKKYGTTLFCRSAGHSQDVFNYSKSCEGNISESDGMCDAFTFPSPQKKQSTLREQAYEHLKPEFEELITILEDSAADSQSISYFKSLYSEITMKARTRLSARLPKPQGSVVSSAAPTSKRLKTHGTQHYSKQKRK
jgi:SWIM zinc finger